MPYKIDFYGDRKPEVLPDGPGKMLYEDYKSGELPERVEIRNFTIPKGKIAGIEYVKDTSRQDAVSDNEVTTLHSKLVNYLDEKGNLPWASELRYMESIGLIRVERRVEVPKTLSDANIFIKPHMTAQYAELQRVLAGWHFKHGAQYRAKKHALQAHAKTAATR